jgi:hypothetical protein
VAITDAALDVRARVIEIDHGWMVNAEALTKGNRLKVIAIPSALWRQPIRAMPPMRHKEGKFILPRPWFWKASKPTFPLEFWSEVLAYHIGAAVGLPVPPCFAARRGDQYGALSLYMLDLFEGEYIIHGGDILLQEKGDYERKKGTDHSVQLIIRAMRAFGIEPEYPCLLRQFVFDGLIGNGDRHQDNWGVLVRPVPRPGSEWPTDILPAFDNGSSLGRELTDDTISGLLRDGKRFEAYINRGTSHVRWEENGKLIPLRHEELVRRHLVEFPELRPDVESFMRFSPERVERSIRRVAALSRTCPGVELSLEREEFLLRLTARRRERLLNVLSE